MPIPRELHLNPRAVEKVERWVKWLKATITQEFANELLDEDCVVTSPISFGLYQTGLGTQIWATCPIGRGRSSKIDLSIDDDNQLVPDEWRK